MVDEIVLVLPHQSFDEYSKLMAGWTSKIHSLHMVPGGDERQHSTEKGLGVLPRDFDGLVLVHDGARPLVSQRLIGDVIEAARRHGSAVAAQPVFETLKEVGEGDLVRGTVDRRRFYRAQTPQCFRHEILRAAMDKAREDRFLGTDEAQLVERMNFEIRIVPGSETNLKVTTAEDLALAAHYLQAEEKGCTTG